MWAVNPFPRAVINELAESKIIRVRSGSEHRYTGIWMVVMERRVFARSWYDKQSGWFRAFLSQPVGSIQLSRREIAVRGRKVRSQRLIDAVTKAYAEKYTTKASLQYVRGFASPKRSVNTLEFIPHKTNPTKAI